MNDVFCNKGHKLVKINGGSGTNKDKTKCNLCNTNLNTFLSCEICKYNLCSECQLDQLKLFETQKLNEECHYDEKNLRFVQGYLDNTSCLSDCGKDSEGFVLCRCGKKYCLQCFHACFPEDNNLIKKMSSVGGTDEESSNRSKEQKEKNINNQNNITTNESIILKEVKTKPKQCHHEKNKFKYNIGHLASVCLGGCERESDGFLECTCGKKLCVICFETIYPEEKGKYLYELKPVNNGCKHDKEILIYNMGKLNDTRCAFGCRRPSNGYMECLCGQNICISCFEQKYPEEKDKYGILQREHLNIFTNSSDFYTASKSLSYKEKLLEDKADIESVHTDNNYLCMRCKRGHELVYSKNYDGNRCSKCNDKGIVIWSCKRCNYYHCKNCIEEDEKERKVCLCCCIY